MRTFLKAGFVTVATGALLAVPLSAASATERHALDVVGLVDGITLVDLETDDTDQHGATDVTGLVGDVSLVGIDYRVQNGRSTASATQAASTRSTGTARPPRSPS